jgi:hypothetical protein
MPVYGDAHRPFPIRRPVTEPLQPVSEGGGVARNQARPSLPELAGFPGITPNTVARAIEDLNRSGYRPLHPPGIAPLSTISVSMATQGAPPGRRR